MPISGPGQSRPCRQESAAAQAWPASGRPVPAPDTLNGTVSPASVSPLIGAAARRAPILSSAPVSARRATAASVRRTVCFTRAVRASSTLTSKVRIAASASVRFESASSARYVNVQLPPADGVPERRRAAGSNARPASPAGSEVRV